MCGTQFLILAKRAPGSLVSCLQYLFRSGEGGQGQLEPRSVLGEQASGAGAGAGWSAGLFENPCLKGQGLQTRVRGETVPHCSLFISVLI